MRMLEEHPPNTNGNPGKAQRNAIIVQQRLEGKTYREIAELHGIHYSRVGHILRDDPRNRLTIQAGIQEAISFMPKVMDNYAELLKSDDDNIKLKTNGELLKIVGITGRHTDNPIINQYFQINNINTLDPGLSKAFGQCFGSLDDDTETIEGEFAADTSNPEGQD